MVNIQYHDMILLLVPYLFDFYFAGFHFRLENKLNMTKVQCIVISEGGKTLKLTKLLNFKSEKRFPSLKSKKIDRPCKRCSTC